jgi:hypothetical protein
MNQFFLTEEVVTMSRSTRNQFGLATLLLAMIAMPLCGCGDPNGVQENPYAAPAPASSAGSGTTATDEQTTADPAAEASHTPE